MSPAEPSYSSSFSEASNQPAPDQVRSFFGRRNDLAASAALLILEQVGPALLLLHRDRTLLWMNREAEQLMREYDLQVRSIPCCSQGVETKRHYDRRGQCLLTTTFPLGDSTGEPIHAVIVSPIGPRRGEHAEPVSCKMLRSAFGLTPAEAKVAAAITGGQTVSEIAENLSVAESTVRTQIKSVFRKTGTRRQSELVRRVLDLQSVLLNLSR